VRYEGQVKVRQQKELADSIMAKVSKELENPKVLQQILQQSVTDVESAYHNESAYQVRIEID
jgi:F-type H+-transporting ATPase subunit b